MWMEKLKRYLYWKELGGGDRASFVEHLEPAVKTPAQIELGFDFASSARSSRLMPHKPVPLFPKKLGLWPAPPGDDVRKSFWKFHDTTLLYGESEEGGGRESGMWQDQNHDMLFMTREAEDQEEHRDDRQPRQRRDRAACRPKHRAT